MFSTQHFYIFLRFLYTFYERIIKAKELITEKVIEEGKGEREAKLNFNLFLCGIASCLAGAMDTNKFEDFERLIMGNKAYFLFTVDKLLGSTIKQLVQIANEEQCQKSYQEYLKHQKILKQSEESWSGEKVYMDEFIRQMEEFGTNFNKVIIRLLYSPQSQVLAIHYVNLNPYNQEKKALGGDFQDISFQRRRPEQLLHQLQNMPTEQTVNIRPTIFLKRNLKRV